MTGAIQFGVLIAAGWLTGSTCLSGCMQKIIARRAEDIWKKETWTSHDAEEYIASGWRFPSTCEEVKNHMSEDTNKLLASINDRLEVILIFLALIFFLVLFKTLI